MVSNPLQTESAEQIVARLQTQITDAQNKNQHRDNAMFSWNLEQLCESTDGDKIGPISELVEFTSVSTDTRTLEPGALYVAIKGENFDGHAFIDEAIKQGAVAVLVSEDIETIVPGVQVEDTRIALGAFARWHRLQMPVKTLIAITGSNGKTSTKTLLQNIFSRIGNTLATFGNLNNDLGVPRTLLNLRPEHEFAIIEMGASGLHEIGYLTNLALPDIALLNNASGAHLEGFGSLQGIINTKGEIFQGLNKIPGRKPGIAIVNTDSPGYDDWIKSLDHLGVENIIRFGTKEAAEVKVSDFEVANAEASAISFRMVVNALDIKAASYSVEMPVLGFHSAMNAAACLAVSIAAGLKWNQIQPGLVSFSGVSGRLQKTKISTGWLIDDSYNANPESVKAGIDALVSLPGEASVCLGAMAEIGETSQQAHQDIAEYAKKRGVKNLYVYGQDTKIMPIAFGENAQYFESHQTLADTLIKDLQTCEEQNQIMNVLVKGSRSAKMEKVVEQVLERVSASQP